MRHRPTPLGGAGERRGRGAAGQEAIEQVKQLRPGDLYMNCFMFMSVDGEDLGLVRLTENPGKDWNPAWTPDGEKIAFQLDREGNNEIYVMNPDGSNQERLAQNAADDGRPCWVPSR